MSPGSFVIVQVYIGQLFWKIAHFGHLAKRIARICTDAESIVKILRRQPMVKDDTDPLNWRWESAFEAENPASVACGSSK